MTLDVSGLQAFSQGEFNQDDTESARQLAAGLAAARSYCGWHVTPVAAATVLTLDGPGAPILVLPTLELTALTTVVELDVNIPIGDLNYSARGLVRKRDYHWWTSDFGSIVVTFSHGLATALDFESAVYSAISRGAFGPPTANYRAIGPFSYETESNVHNGLFTDAERAILDRYRLEKMP